MSPGANGATVAAGPHGGTQATTVYDLSSNSGLCSITASVRSCKLNVTVLTGSDDFTITLYDTSPVSGAIPASAHILGVSTNSNVTVTAGVTAKVTAYVMPTIASVNVNVPNIATVAANGQPQSTNVIVNPTDFSNNTITAGVNDNYSNPITIAVTETGGSGHLTLSLNGTPSGTSVTLTQSSQTLGISYDGGGTPGYYATITASATGITPKSFNVVPMYVTSASQYFANHALAFTGAGEGVTFTINEALGTNSYTASLTTGAACAAAASFNPASGSGTTGQLIVASQSGAAASGACAFTIADSLNTQLTIPVTNTITSGGVTIGGIAEYNTPISQPTRIVAGADGYLFVTGGNGANPPTVWTYTTADNPGNWSAALPAAPIATTIGPDSNLWFVTRTGSVYTWSDASSASNALAYPVSGASQLDQITVGPDGNMWAVDDYISATLKVLSPTQPVALLASYAIPCPCLGIASSGGNVWIITSNTIESGAPNTNPNTSYPPPTGSPSFGGIAADTQGNLWMTDLLGNNLYEFTPPSTWNSFSIGQNDSPGSLVVGPDGNVYFSANASNSIGKFNTTTHLFSHFAVPTASAGLAGITVGADGRIWFAESSVGKIGALTP